MIDFTDPNTLVGIGTLIAAFVSIVAIIITLRQERDSRYLQFLKEVDTELISYNEKLSKLKKDDADVFAYDYISVSERICFLLSKGKISKDFEGYFLDAFNYAMTMMWWYSNDDSTSLRTSWPEFTNWILLKERRPDDFKDLPAVMRDGIQSKTSSEIYDDLLMRLRKAEKIA